jgi:PAS domain S-box-containing protein
MPPSPVPDFQSIFDSVPGLYLVLRADDPVFTIVAANQAYTDATLTRAEEIIGRPVFEVFPDNPDDPRASSVEALKTSFRQVIATKKRHTILAQKYDIRRPTSQGGGFEERFWTPVNTPVLGDDGEVRYIVHGVEDVTELVRLKQEIEAKLVASEARFTLAFAKAPIGMVLLTLEGRIAEVNQAFVEMMGYSREELRTRDSSSYTHPDDIELTRNLFLTLREGPQDTRSIEKRYFRKDGELLWARASVTMRRDQAGMPVEAVAIVEDITLRKRAEVRYRFLAESIPQMVWTATPDGMLDYVNARGSAYFGVPQEALLGAGWLHWVHPDEKDNVVAVWKQALETGANYETEFRLKRGSDSLWRWHLVRARPLTGDAGNIVQWFGTCTDIEDQRRASADLRQQWQTFDTALSNTPDFIYIYDLSGRFTYANRALLSVWQESLEEAIGKSVFDRYEPELAARLQGQIQRVIATSERLRDQTSFSMRSGETRFFDYILVPVLDVSGRVRAIAGSTRDITDYKKTAQQIEEDRRRWRDVLIQTPAAIALLRGPEHRFEWVNPDFAALMGRPAEALVGRTLLEGVPEAEKQKYVALLDGVFQRGESVAERESLVLLDRKGNGTFDELYVNFAYLPTRDANGEIDGVFVHVTDVSEAVSARKQIEESERQFRTLAESIPQLAWMADGTGYLLWYNRRWYDYTGTTLEEMEGWGWQKVHDPKVLPDVIQQWRGAIDSGEPFEMIFPLRRADGEFRQFLTRIEPVKDNQGRVVRWFGTNTDITDQTRTEQELRRMNRELEEFAYVASHDLQEPLRIVNIYTELILKNAGTNGANQEKLHQYSDFVKQGVLRMEALIHDLLTFSRSVHTEELPMGRADLSSALADALSVLKSRIEENGAVISICDFPEVRGDTGQLSHVFQNILSNALKYRKTDAAPQIRICSSRKQNMCVVSVEDAGIGFDPQYAERIFGLFKRLHKDEYPGTGLGLAICKRIVERCGGTIWAEGKVGEGATFYFTLPCMEEAR